MMFGSMPTPHRTLPSGSDGLDVGDRGGVGPLPDGVLGVVDDVELDAEAVAQRVHERGDRAVALADDRAGLPSTTSCAVIDVRPVAESLCSSWLSSRNRGSAGRYSCWNASHITTGLISVPVSSVMCWIVLENSICSRRGRSKPCSAFMM